jgi:hypothetical protein
MAKLAALLGLVGMCTVGMPWVDIGGAMTAAVGYDTPRINATTESPVAASDSAFRIFCPASHMSNDDPIVYPGQQGRAHHHTFFGNVAINYATTDPSASGNSTCVGGVINRSGYWVPSVIDTRTGRPVQPDGNLIYYKRGYNGVQASQITVPPAGLRMIVGNMYASDPANAIWNSPFFFECIGSAPYARGMSIPACKVGERLQLVITLPQCWDGVNLDSADHKSHMAPAKNGCPATHPVPIPAISFNILYTVKTGDDPTKWRLSSDMYEWSKPAGYSAHGDWWNGWDQTVLTQIVRECLNAGKDCHAHLIGNGQAIY